MEDPETEISAVGRLQNKDGSNSLYGGQPLLPGLQSLGRQRRSSPSRSYLQPYENQSRQAVGF